MRPGPQRRVEPSPHTKRISHFGFPMTPADRVTSRLIVRRSVPDAHRRRGHERLVKAPPPQPAHAPHAAVDGERAVRRGAWAGLPRVRADACAGDAPAGRATPSQVAGRRRRAASGRECLGHEQDRVARHEEMVPPRQLVRRTLAGVQCDRRLITAAPARQPQPQGQVDVLQVGEVALVEPAELEHRRAPVERRARARSEHLARPCPSARRPYRSARAARRRRLGAARRRRRRHGSGRPARASCRRRGRARGSRSIAATIRASQSGSSTTSVLTSATSSPRAASSPAVGGVGKAGVVAERQDSHVGMGRAQVVDRAVVRAVVDDDHLGGASSCAAIAPRQPGSQSRPFQFGITTEIGGCPGALIGA